MNDFDNMREAARRAFSIVDGEEILSAPFGTGKVRVVLMQLRANSHGHLYLEHVDRSASTVYAAHIDNTAEAYLLAAALIEAADAVVRSDEERMQEIEKRRASAPALSKPEERLVTARVEDDMSMPPFAPGTPVYREVDGDGQIRTIELMLDDGIIKPNGPAIHVERTIAHSSTAPIERVWMALTEEPPLKAGQPPRQRMSWGDTAEEAMKFAKAGRKGH